MSGACGGFCNSWAPTSEHVSEMREINFQMPLPEPSSCFVFLLQMERKKAEPMGQNLVFQSCLTSYVTLGTVFCHSEPQVPPL